MACNQSSFYKECQEQPRTWSGSPDQFGLCNECLNGTLSASFICSYLTNNPDASLNTPIGERQLTPLAIACEGGQVGTVLLLLEHGADPDAVSARRRPPLFYATTRAQRNRLEIVRILLNHGAAIEKRFPEDYDATAIMNAITEVHDSEVVRELVIRGASLHAENAGGQSVWMLAREYGMEQELGSIASNPEPSTQCSILVSVIMALVMLVAGHVVDKSIKNLVSGAAQSLLAGTSNSAQLKVSCMKFCTIDILTSLGRILLG